MSRVEMIGRQLSPDRHGCTLCTVADDRSPATLLRVCERLTTALDVWECSVYQYDAERDSLIGEAIWSRDLKQEDIDFIGVPNTINRQRDLDAVFRDRATVVVHAEDEKGGTPERERMDQWGEKSALYAPLVVDDEILGVLELTERRERRDFDAAALRLVTALADVAAIAIDNARVSRRQQQANARLNALLDSSRALASTVVVAEVLQLVAERAASALEAPSCYIYEYDASADAIIWRSEYQADRSRLDPESPGTVYPLDDFPWDRATLNSGEVRQMSVDDPDLEPGARANMGVWSEQTMLTVPLIFGDTTVGMLEIAETRPGRRFSVDEVQLASALGQQAAAAIRNAQLYRRETWRNERLVKALDISLALSGSLDAGQVVEGVRSRIGDLFPERAASVDVVSLGAAGDACGDTPAAAAQDAAVADMLEGLHAVQVLRGSRRHLMAPLITQGRAEGWIEIVADRPAAFDDDEAELVQMIANQAAAALDNTRLYATLAQQAITDGLTGLFNHRYFYERLRDEVARARRYDFPLSLLMMDLDDFKHYNDRFGHPAGDGVLRRVAEIMKAQLRQNVDIAARYGGEEFVAILPHTPAAGAERVGERLSAELGALEPDRLPDAGAVAAGERVRHGVEDTPFPAGDPLHVAHVTISVGVASLPAHALDVEELVGAADKALYLAKQHGKNRVEVFH